MGLSGLRWGFHKGNGLPGGMIKVTGMFHAGSHHHGGAFH